MDSFGMMNELSLIGQDIKSLNDLELQQSLVSINLHCNLITKIENLQLLANLRSLDLSSNKISKIEGLDCLLNLRFLNLSCNEIKKVEGLSKLRSLVMIDLSYNKITDLTGLKDIRSVSHSLRYLDLNGNMIISLSHAIQCLANCTKLEFLTFKDENNGNPICDIPAYRPNLFAQLPSLKALDEKDIHQNRVLLANRLQELKTGTDAYVDWFNEADSSTIAEDELSLPDFTTPKIDEILQMFKQRKSTQSESVHDNRSQTIEESGAVTERLKSLEHQISSLLQFEMGKKVPETNKTTTTTSASSPELTKTSAKKQVGLQTVRRNAFGVNDRQKKNFRIRNTAQGKSVENSKSSVSSQGQKMTRTVRDPKDDESALLLMQELEGERERRWKAEQAARKLVDTVKQMQERIVEERRLQEAAISTSTRLKAALTSERDTRNNLEKLLSEREAEHEKICKQFASLQTSEAETRELLKSLEDVTKNSENERIKQQAFQGKQIQDARLKAAASMRETELLRANVKNLKQQVIQLQELLANREQDHKQLMDGMVKLDGKEMKDAIDKEIAKQEGKYTQLFQQCNERLEARNQDYAMLEDEFRMGLQIEAKRFSELQDAYTEIVNEAADLKQSLQLSRQKESKATSLVNELTSMVKEQKGRLTEISKSKQEIQSNFKDRIQILESQLDTSRKQLTKMDSIRQEKDRLLAQTNAQQSVIDGLRTERRLWGHELAQQGASLAQDRGRMESQIESLTAQLKHFKEKGKEDVDSLRIKSKLVEDQTDTIKKLKQDLADQRTESKRSLDDALLQIKNLEKEIDEEKRSFIEIQESMETLTERKEELKEELRKSRKDLEMSQVELRTLKKQWDERSSLIGQLEEKVLKMKEIFDVKEKKLKEERDSSLKQASSAMEKARLCDDAFRKQLDERQREHELDIRKIISEKDEEINKAKSKVNDVEDEMRILLEETAISKRNLEQKVKQLSKSLLEVQHHLAI